MGQAYMYNDDDFNWNHGLSLASTGNYKASDAIFPASLSQTLLSIIRLRDTPCTVVEYMLVETICIAPSSTNMTLERDAMGR